MLHLKEAAVSEPVHSVTLRRQKIFTTHLTQTTGSLKKNGPILMSFI